MKPAQQDASIRDRPMDERAIVLLSGGLDSTTTLYYAMDQGYHITALSFHYGQRHSVELERARRIAKKANVLDHRIIQLDPNLFSGTALVNREIEVPMDREIDDSIPVTYVPARNTLFLAHALALAESQEARYILIGANALDYSGYPDCRPDYLQAFETMANLGTRRGIESGFFKVLAPLVHLKKSEIIQLGLDLGVDYGDTVSCYNPDEKGNPCGHCDSCIIRRKGFQELGLRDPSL